MFFINQKLTLGYGLTAYIGVGNDELHKTLFELAGITSAAHSGYLTYFLMFGLPIGMILVIIKLYPVLKSLFRMNDKYFDVIYKTTKIISITYLLLGITESAFTGVNDITAILYLSVWIIMVHFCFSNEMFLKMNNYHRVSH